MEKYLAYLSYLNNKLEKDFASQKPYIFCKKGCAKCCKNSRYFFSNIEFEYLKYGFEKLDSATKSQIKLNIENLKKEYKNNSKSYACPFLINDECSVYEYRGIVCRTFGLSQLGPNSELKVPFCAYNGLNYSNVIDLETGKVSAEKFKRLNTDLEPLAFNIAYLNLVDEDIAKAFGFEFGEIKSLVEWL